jgi:NAD+ kinase
MEKQPVKKVGIVVKPNSPEAFSTALELSAWLASNGIEQVGDPCVWSENPANNPEPAREELAANADMIVVLGGDGTMISTARLVENHNPLVLGINYGSLGYLTEFRIEEMVPALEMMLAGEYEVDHRVMLDAEHIRGG